MEREKCNVLSTAFPWLCQLSSPPLEGGNEVHLVALCLMCSMGALTKRLLLSIKNEIIKEGKIKEKKKCLPLLGLLAHQMYH